MRRWRRIAEFGEAEFLGASFHDAPRRLEDSVLEVLTDHTPQSLAQSAALRYNKALKEVSRMDERLMAAASLVRSGCAVCDVGADHGYLAAFLAEEGRAGRVTASDVNPGPLEAARRTLAARGLAEKVRLVLSDGLKEIPPEDAMDVVICGMGGELIAQLVLACPYLRDPERRLILQPMTQAPWLRECLSREGFRLLRELPVIERNHCYTVMHWQYEGPSRSCSLLERAVGRIPQEDSPAAGLFLERDLRRAGEIAQGLERSAEPAGAAPWRALEQALSDALEQWRIRQIRKEKEL